MLNRDQVDEILDLQRRSYALLRWIDAKVQSGTLPLGSLHDALDAAHAPRFRRSSRAHPGKGAVAERSSQTTFLKLHAARVLQRRRPDAEGPMEVIGIDHIYLAVSDFAASESFYDSVMRALGFYKGDRPIGGERHAHYFNRVLQISIRPARTVRAHDPYAPGLHHLCLQVATPADVDAAYAKVHGLGIAATPPRTYPEYAADYYATFFADPDGIRLEIVSRRKMRDDIVREWDQLRSFLNPLQELQRERASSAGAGPDRR